MGQPRTVTVEAVTPCRLFRISAEQIVRRFETLDPVLRACIETSINFTAAYNKQQYDDTESVPVAPKTLRNSRELIEHFKFEQDILTGLKKGEFSLVYQPIIQLSNREIVGFEALMRWEHSALGNIPPFRFVAVAEAMGSVGKLTEFALSEACAALQRMRAADPSARDFYMSVNISGKDLENDSFVDFVAHVLDRNHVDARGLKLEVTETALVADPDGAARQLGKRRDLGCGISIDDFGTGYSNLAYLKALPFTTLKIDRAFAGDAHANAVSRSIVRMLLGLGVELGKDIVAEGLETIDDVTTLRDLGCSFAQGYHFCKPATEAEMFDVIRAFGSGSSCAVA